MHGSCIRSHIPNRASASLLPRDIPFARHSFFCFVLSRRWKKYCVVFQGWEETVWLTISLQLFSPTIHILVERLNCLKINSEGNLFYSESMRKINIKYFFFCFSFKYLLYWIFFSFFFFGANFSVVLYTEHAFSALHQRTILIPYILYQTTFLSWTKWNSIFHGQRNDHRVDTVSNSALYIHLSILLPRILRYNDLYINRK